VKNELQAAEKTASGKEQNVYTLAVRFHGKQTLDGPIITKSFYPQIYSPAAALTPADDLKRINLGPETFAPGKISR